jgi:7-carboxy-7-deazaguanine synthase
MLISEIFYSLQGEGELTGVPSVFIRTSGCNLRCSWCDTPYASWHPEGQEISEGEILTEVRKYPARHCVLTGGEPMVARQIHELATCLKQEGYHITIETAGTIVPNGIACDLASLSPKLSNSTPDVSAISPAWVKRHETTRFQPEVLRQWVSCYPFQLKFVVSSAEDLPEIEAVVAGIGESIPAWRIQLMPEGTDSAVLSSRRTDLIALCREKGYRLCDRLHIHLFGNSKGT